MHKNATKCNKKQSKWCINKHGSSKIIDTFETYHCSDECGPCMLVCLHAYICFCLTAIDSNDNERTKEGGVFEYQEEDQGQADQGKPSKLIAYLILVFSLHDL
jgi:hypothetical protein